MKRVLTLCLAFVLGLNVMAAPVAVAPSKPKNGPNAHDIMLPIGKNGEKVSLYDLSVMKAKELEAVTGKKMKLSDRIGFRMAQQQLRNSISADGTVETKKLKKFAAKAEGDGGFHIGGFALGFLLGLIGVLIAYLINDDKKATRVKWAWLGLAAWLVILLIALVL